MDLYKLVRRHSPISGYGVFSEEDIPKGALVIGAPTIMGKIVTSEKTAKKIFDLSEHAGTDPFLRVFHRSCVRLIGNHFSFNDRLVDTDYLNHSFEANLLFAFGHCIARRDITSGEELTIDYRLVLPEGDSIGLDRVSNEPITGLSALGAIKAVSLELERLFS